LRAAIGGLKVLKNVIAIHRVHKLRQGKREAISLAPRLQPGDQVPQTTQKPFRTVSADPHQQKPLKTVHLPFWFPITGLKPRCELDRSALLRKRL